MKKPYKQWTRDQLWDMLSKQATDQGFDSSLLWSAIYDDSWSPADQFNGCNFVQDNLHPFLPCFIHDWRWVCFEYDVKFDREFETNLRAFGFSKAKAKLYFCAVRLGWLFYYRFKKN